MNAIYTKTCENCKYFVRHYIKNSSSFKALTLGHCMSTRRTKKLLCDYDNCERWEQGSENNDFNCQTVKKKLIDISEQLERIAGLLEYEISQP